MIRDALSGLRAGPGFYAAVVLAAGVLAWYYASQHRDCTEHSEWREQLRDAISAPAPGSRGFRLAEAVSFGWDRVHVRAGAKIENTIMDCPFGWDWPRARYDALADDGLLTMLIFTSRGQFVDHLGLDGGEIDFSGVTGVWTPDTAVFRVARGSSSQLRLHPFEDDQAAHPE